MYRILNKIFKAIDDNGINKAEIDCENGLNSTYQCFYKDGKIIVLFQTRQYTNETLNHWGEHDNDFAKNTFKHSFLEFDTIQIDQDTKRQITKDDYTNLIVWYVENRFNNRYEWGEDVVDSLHFNLL